MNVLYLPGYSGQPFLYIHIIRPSDTFSVDLKTSKVKPLYVLKDSYAIEGITIVDDVLYVLNDGYYHDAETPINQVNMYFLNKMQTKENYQ